MKYRSHWINDIVEAFIGTHPRGWALFQSIFYIRPETMVTVFIESQFLWNKIKDMVKNWDKMSTKTGKIVTTADVKRLSKNCKIKLIMDKLSQIEHFTDPIDVLLYKKNDPQPTAR